MSEGRIAEPDSDRPRAMQERQTAKDESGASILEAVNRPLDAFASSALLPMLDQASRVSLLERHQKTYGNSFVQRLLHPTPADRDDESTPIPIRNDAAEKEASGSPDAGGSFQSVTSVERYPFQAALRRRAAEPASEQSADMPSRQDAPPGAEIQGEQYLTLFE